jgi:hypothetical protein
MRSWPRLPTPSLAPAKTIRQCHLKAGMRPTVLIVDSDLGLVMWLGQIFTDAGCHAIPALNCTQAVSLMRTVNVPLDLVAVNTGLTEIASMLRTLRHAHRNLKVIAIGDIDAVTAGTIRPQAMLPKPRGWEPLSREDWVGLVKKILREIRATDTDR